MINEIVKNIIRFFTNKEVIVSLLVLFVFAGVSAYLLGRYVGYQMKKESKK